MDVQPVTSDDLARFRRELLRLLDRLDGRGGSGIGPAARVADLVRSERVPRYIGALMKTVLEARNAAEYDSLVLTKAEGEAVRNAIVAIREWVERREPPIAA